MGKKGGSAPQAPDPVQTGAAQTGTNVSTAIANAWLNNTNQITPDGSKTFSQSGTYNWTDPTSGKTYAIPKFTSTERLSPQQRAIKGQSDKASFNLAQLARQQSGRLGGLLSRPLDISNESTEARLEELGRSRLDPALARRRESTATQLANQGVRLGSTAYDRAMEGVTQSENDAYNQLFLTGRQQAVNEQLTERNQPLNEIAALLGTGQVSQPQFSGGGTGASIPTTDYAGLQNAAYQNNYNAWQQKQQQQQGTLGGLFGLASSMVMASDRRLKRDVAKIGERGGLNLYQYRYAWDHPGTVRRGYMAQEVADVFPRAVRRLGRWLALDYTMLPEVN